MRLFLASASLFNLGLFVFFLLYNLYLLELGFDESFLGILTGAMTAGSVCGTLPAGWIVGRLGPGAGLRITFAGAAAVCLLRASTADRAALVALAFLGGAATAFWAVTFAPAVAQLTSEAERPRAFSLFFALGVGMGILGGLAGGELPDWIGRIRGSTAASSNKQAALWLSAGFSALALIPAWRLKLTPAEASSGGRLAAARIPFVRRYLVAAAAWNLFTGAFPPFLNTYLARRFAATTGRIGRVFSGAQLAQAAAMLLAPRLFARVGLNAGIAGTELAAAALLAALAGASTLPAAAVGYAAYLALQWMSEPGWQSLLMNGVPPEQRSGASALNYLVVFSAQAVAAAAFGAAVPRHGYPASLASTTAVGVLAAGLFWRLLGVDRTSWVGLGR